MTALALPAPSRRGFLGGALALVAAPAIIKVASLMPVNASLVPNSGLLTKKQIVREAVRLNSNRVMHELAQYQPLSEPPVRLDVLYGKMDAPIGALLRDRFNAAADMMANEMAEAVMARDFYEGAQWNEEQIGTVLRIRLPNDFVYNKERRSLDRVAPPIDKLALAVAAPVLVAKALEQPVTRRFWKR